MTSHTHVATIKTNLGSIKVNLFALHAPKTVENFIGLADGSIEWTHPKRGPQPKGTPTGTGMGGPGYNFGDEIHAELNFNEPYKLAMANAGPGTNGSQWFITTVPTTWLFGKHTVFGDVVDPDSRKVVDKIQAVETGAQDKPIDDVVIESISIETL